MDLVNTNNKIVQNNKNTDSVSITYYEKTTRKLQQMEMINNPQCVSSVPLTISQAQNVPLFVTKLKQIFHSIPLHYEKCLYN